jgi:transcriptional antiterminator NusG
MDQEPKASSTNKKHQTFRLGDTVRIVSGPFVSFTGKIEGINQSKALLQVKVTIYGRSKPIRLNFADVEVVSASS